MTSPPIGQIKKMKNIVSIVIKIVCLLAFLFFFICSLSFLSDSFRILGGRNIGSLFSNSELLKNPVVGVMIGVLVTVLVQSSSTSTSIIVGLVAAGAPVREAVPMIMGANIGTSVTNILVALTQAGERDQFRRAFACANVHDMFNWLSAFILVIVEATTGYLQFSTKMIVDLIHGSDNSTSIAINSKGPDFLKALTSPITKLVIQLDKNVLKGWAIHDPHYDNATIFKVGCTGLEEEEIVCPYLFAYILDAGASKILIGVLLLGISLCMLCSCLIGMVKILNALLGPKVREMIQNVINADIPVSGLGWLTGYLAMLLGALLTILVQSSSVFTSTLTPLAGQGLISLERAYPMTLGSNLGTTTTSLLASFAAGGSNVREANQIALVHLLFNLTGILMFYPVPCMRWPVSIARVLGDVTAKYRWFAVVYLSFMFFLFPSSLFLLSLAGPIPLYLFLVPGIGIVIFAVIVNILQNKKSRLLPKLLDDWEFLPLWMHSMEPYDKVVMKIFSICKCCRPKIVVTEAVVVEVSTFPNVGYNKLSNVPSSASLCTENVNASSPFFGTETLNAGSICTGVKVVKENNPRQQEEYSLLLNCAQSQSPSPRDQSPKDSI